MKKEVQNVSDSLSVKASPGIKTAVQWGTVMFDMQIALLPAVLFAAYQFGFDAIKVILASVLASVLTEWIYEVCLKKEVKVFDGTAVVTGLLLGLSMPAGVDLYIPVIGSIFATLVVVLLYGGYGQHFMVPALVARCFLFISFTSQMTTYTIDGISSATPLVTLTSGTIPDVTSMFVGTVNGCIGEVSAIAILIGFVWLVIRKACKVVTPVVYFLSFVICIALLGGHGMDMKYVAAEVLGGGFLFTLVFFSSDLAVNPKSVKGQVVYGLLLGLLSAIYRAMASSTENISYAVISCNMLIPLLDKFLPEKAKEEA